MPGFYEIKGNHLILRLWVQPKSSKTAWGDVVERGEERWVRLKVSSPPVDGAANKEVIAFIAKEFKTAKSNVTLLQGDKRRIKVLRVESFDEKKWQAFLQAQGLQNA